MQLIITSLILGLFLLLSLILRLTIKERNNKELNKTQNKEKLSSREVLNRLTKVAIFGALSFLLYFLKFNLPFIFPSFLEINFSMLPIILAGFVLGPWWASLVVLLRFVLKLPFSSTAYVGEAADLIIGLFVLIPSSLFYQYHKDKKGGIISLVLVVAMWVVAGILSNVCINIPFYVNFYFGGNMAPLVGMVSGLYKGVTEETFMHYYILLGVIPFNLLLSLIVSIVTYFVYKRVSIIFKKDFFGWRKK